MKTTLFIDDVIDPGDVRYSCRFSDDNGTTGCVCEDGDCEDDLCISRTYITCIKCDTRTCYGCSFDSNAMFDRTIVSYECKTCTGYYNVCHNHLESCLRQNMNTVELCSLVKHHNYDKLTTDGSNYVISDEECDEYYDATIIKYTSPEYMYDESIFGDITGPDGGFSSTWSCSHCDKTWSFLDK
jgi:hypothetical protein